jgi:hypothetical protein
MIDFTLDPKKAILTIRPESALGKEDFVRLAKAVDPEIEEHGDLAGLIIEAPRFPGWDSFGALVNHLRFLRDHHRHIKKVAVVTDSALGEAAEHIASHFVAADIKHFPADEADAARAWIAGPEGQ